MNLNAEEKATPMMAQYQQLKAQHPEAILFYRLGDFYEMFGEDAKVASRILEITLTARSAGEGRAVKIPMCGVPFHAADNYIQRLLKAGRKVAIVEQMEDPRKTKSMVRRELVRIVTPGTVLNPGGLEAKQNNYLAALACDARKFGVAAVDLSTGEFWVMETGGAQALDEALMELYRWRPSELLVPEGVSPELRESIQRSLDSVTFSEREGYHFDPEAGRAALTEFFGIHSLDGFGLGDYSFGLGAGAAVLQYLSETQRGALAHIRKIKPYSLRNYMILDETTLRNLEIDRNSSDGSRKHTLLETLDYTLTAMGGRRLHHWILRPLISPEQIAERQSAVADLAESIRRRQALYEVLSPMHDLERLSGRVGAATATPRDLQALFKSLEQVPKIKSSLRDCSAECLRQTAATLPECEEVRSLIGRALADEPPAMWKEGGIFRDGFHSEVDELRSLTREGKGYIAAFQAREKEKTGIGSLKVEFNSIFGYYIEVSKVNSRLVPPEYQRKQTLANAERYTTPELKEHEAKVLGAQEKLLELEERLFLELRQAVSRSLPEIFQASEKIAELDALLSLAEAAVKHNYVRPRLEDSQGLDIRDGRHPVVERLTPRKFVPNDLHLDEKTRQLIILTGPNMAGKSTYLRQTALIVVMAQMGGFVPAAEAKIGWVDRVFTRVGAADNLAGGQSTFMVEMSETANILNNATPRSLVILDEVGRGTSTFDGVSIAWAVAEYLHDFVKAKTIFATHYYELTELALTKERVKNCNIAVREWQEEIIFLRKIVEGSADRSYGIQVARLAGLPKEVLERAQEVLINLEKANYTESGNSRLAVHGSEKISAQLSFEEKTKPSEELISHIELLDPNSMTPLEALNQLAMLKERVRVLKS